jgi:hypothetical protein
MQSEDEEITEQRLRNGERVVESHLRPRLERAERLYSQALTSLWVGNAGAALATISFIGAAWKNGSFPKELLYPLAFFMSGVISMGLGAFLALIKETRAILRIQRIDHVLDMRWDDIQSPAESIGLSLRETRTVLALIAGFCFIAGCILGLIQLATRAA